MLLKLQSGHEAYCEDHDIAGGHICLLDGPIANLNDSPQLYLVGKLLPIVFFISILPLILTMFLWLLITFFIYSHTYVMLLTSFPATFVLHCVIRMLWSINGWSWSDAIPNLPPRGCVVAAGIYFHLFSTSHIKFSFFFLKSKGYWHTIFSLL